MSHCLPAPPQVRNTLEIQFNSLQIDFDNLHHQLEEETEAGNGLRSQVAKASAEHLALKVGHTHFL